MNNTQQIVERIYQLYHDTSVSVDDTVDALETIIEEAQDLLSTL